MEEVLISSCLDLELIDDAGLPVASQLMLVPYYTAWLQRCARTTPSFLQGMFSADSNSQPLDLLMQHPTEQIVVLHST